MCNRPILLCDTEIPLSLEKFDCIYVRDNADTKNGRVAMAKVSYCLRADITGNYTITTNRCMNGGQMKYFVDLSKENV
jgi:hypothetical protein